MVGGKFHAKEKGIQSVHEFFPFKDFEIYFAGWKLPSEGLGQNKVREYINRSLLKNIHMIPLKSRSARTSLWNSTSMTLKICIVNLGMSFNYMDLEVIKF
jgi:hypothetical protein